jgi:hypothetical protein
MYQNFEDCLCLIDKEFKHILESLILLQIWTLFYSVFYKINLATDQGSTNPVIDI